MTRWQKVKLGDVFEVARGGSPRPIDSYITCDEDGINWIKIGDTVENSKYITVTKQKIKKEGLKKSRYVQSGDFLLSNSMSFGRPYILRTNGCIHDGWLVLRDKRNVYHKEFLYYVLLSPTMYRKFEQQAVGGVVNNLNSDIVRNVIIPLPPMEEQEKIAKELDSVAELLEKQKQLLTEQDTLIKSIFYDMFGDPITNDKGWKVEKLKDICTKITDGTHDTPKRYNSGILLLTGKNIRSFRIVLDEVEYVSVEDHKIIYKRCNPEYGDVLYTNIGVNYGTAAFNNIKNEFSMKNVALLKPIKNIIHGYYLQSVLNYKRECIITHNKAGGAQTFMGLETIKNIEIHTPPLSLQQKFAAIVEEIEAQKEKIKASISETQTLFNALMAKYFDEE